MNKTARRRWPVTNTDELVRHVARQFPEITRGQVTGVLYTAMQSILNSLGEQARLGAERPSVKIQNFGTFELRWYRSSRRPHLNGTLRVVAPRWRVGFRPSARWAAPMASWSLETRNTSEGLPMEPHMETLACPRTDEEATASVSDVRTDGWEADDRRGTEARRRSTSQAETGPEEREV